MSIPAFPRARTDSSGGPPATRKQWPKRALAILVLVAVAGYLFRDAILGEPVEVNEVTRGDLIQTVVASGRVMTPQRISVGTVITERVVRIPVEEGQSVRRDDLLIALDDRDERAAVTQAQAAVAQAEAKLRQLREVGLPAATESLRQAEANVRLARQQYDRNVELKSKGFISESVLDDAKRNLDVADSQLNAARVQVRTNSPSGSDFGMAQTALEQARAALGAANAKLDQTVIRAPVDGILIGRSVEPGDVVQPGKELMSLAPAGETQIVVQIDEKNLAQLKLGERAFASADAYPRERFVADLFYVNPGIDPLRGSVEVKLRVPEPPAYLRQDMTVSVDIEVARRKGTLVASSDAVFDSAGTQPWVLAVDDGRARKKPVTLGLKGEGRIEILEGVGEGERLILSSAAVSPGQRVRIVAPEIGTTR